MGELSQRGAIFIVLIRPRLTEANGIFIPQEKLSFAIPFLEEDIPLYVDPFLMWKSPSQQDQSLHHAILNAFNSIGQLYINGEEDKARRLLIMASECEEVGLGDASKKKGKRISEKQADDILTLFRNIPRYAKYSFEHIEEIQFFIDGIAKDRISDFSCNFIKSFLIDFTIDECERLGILLSDCTIHNIYNLKKRDYEDEQVKLPVNSQTNEPLIIVPKRWLRFVPWLNFDNYYTNYCPHDDVFKNGEPFSRVKVLTYNRENYGQVETYVRERERTSSDCKNDPLFEQIPVTSAKRHLREIKKLPTGKTDNADKKYEDAISSLMASLMYPHLDFAQSQVRIESGSQIRDLIFYNNRTHDFLKELFDDYKSKQLVFELKNVREIEREHINQLNRYMTEDFGKFGVIVTRNELSKAMRQNVIDLWSGQRRCIITLVDNDIEQMVELFGSKQRTPLDVLKKKYIEFRRSCPS